jgi:hypothetical protein
MSKKKDAAAPSEPEAETRAIDELDSMPPVEGPDAGEAADHAEYLADKAADAQVNEAPPPKPAPKAPETFEQWASAKGHIKRLPPPGRPRGAYVQPGPDFRVVKAHTRWPANQVVSESEYDAAVKDTYGQELRER